MLLCSMYMIFLHAYNSFSSLLTLNVSCCNWSSLGIIEEMIRSHGRLTLLFMSKARTIILPAILVGMESLLRSFVQVCILTTQHLGFSLLAVLRSTSYRWYLLQGNNGCTSKFQFFVNLPSFNTFHHRIANYQNFSELSFFLVYSHCLFDLE